MPRVLFIILLMGAGYLAAQAEDTRLKTSEKAPVKEHGDHLWLEEVDGDDALAWVTAQNDRSLGILKSDPNYERFEAAALDVATSDARIPYGTLRDGVVYNFWQDETHIRGLWRRTPLESYKRDTPDWETVLDIDALAEEEGANWVFKGANCYEPASGPIRKCLVSLSDGGKDAVIQREFDLDSKTFVAGGFVTPEAKQSIDWVDEDTLLVGTDWGGDGSTLTESGYPSIVKRWKRATPLETAEPLIMGEKSDVGVWPVTLHLDDGGVLEGAVEADTFFTSTYHFEVNGEVRALPLPPKSTVHDVYQSQLIVSLEQDWVPHEGAQPFKAGDLLAFDLPTWLAGHEGVHSELIYRPGPRQSFEGFRRAGDSALVSINDNVVGKLLWLNFAEEGWVLAPVELPGNGQASLAFANRRERTAFINYEGFLTPDSLLAHDTASDTVETLKALPETFDTEGLVAQQFEATSKDGTKIPYFVVHRADRPLGPKTPTLLYGYGGFQVSLSPSYSGLIGKLWLEEGGAYVLANIRGGGEFGPNWHQAGLKTERQRIYDDFIAVGEHLVAEGFTSPRHLGIMGGSNGGLLMGVMLNQRPDLWNGVVVQVPLLDMLRYHLLLAGASWVDEYGSPEIPEERAFLETISPYHNFDPSGDYPTPFFVTSTKDDRVHPGHARKMAKLFEEAGKPFFYYENTDGGHAAAADQTARAKRSALEFTYLARQLFPDASEKHDP